jgi:myosin protein heavy chain
LQAKKRLHNELEDYRNRRAADLEDKESSMEQTRKKYQTELSTLTGELEIERENLVQSRAENRRLREEVEDLRAKWDDEVLNSSTWAKEKSRLEIKLQDLTQSHDDAVAAHNEVQSRVVSLLAQVRSLRANVDDVVADRDLLQKEKRSLEQRLAEASQRLEDLANGESPAMRNAAGMDRELLDLKGSLAQQEDLASAALEKMRRAEALASETQRDIAAERESNVALHKEKAQLEKQVKDLQLKLVDLETKSYSSTSHDIRFLHGRVQEVSPSHSKLGRFQILTSVPTARESTRRARESQITI